MFYKDCVFCKIIQKEVPSNIITEDENIIVIEDISPKAPIHYLIIPKKHIVNINYITDEDLKYASFMTKAARDIAKQLQQTLNKEKPLAFNLISNNEAAAGQAVFHMHWHFISGKKIWNCSCE